MKIKKIKILRNHFIIKLLIDLHGKIFDFIIVIYEKLLKCFALHLKSEKPVFLYRLL